MTCRHCHSPLDVVCLDLGHSPPSNAYRTQEDLNRPEVYYPLKLRVCAKCWLVQTQDYAKADELFPPDYAYFSSTSSTWMAHARQYSVDIVNCLGLGPHSFVVEVAANDGYLLKNFVAAGIPCLGIEPTKSTADVAEAAGIPVVREFFGSALAARLAAIGKGADLIVGNNVYAHVPDINDFTTGIKRLLKPHGTVTMEFPHLLQLIEHAQFDTVYHEHFSYLSLTTSCRIFRECGLRIWDVRELPTHGGSLRIYGCHDCDPRPTKASVAEMLLREQMEGLFDVNTYISFQSRANKIKNSLLKFLIEKKLAGSTVAAYGAAAKGNTLLNYAGVRPDLVGFVCDASPSKQGKYLPGSHIPVLPPSALKEKRPDFVLILPWNIAPEIFREQRQVAELGSKFVTVIPELKVWN